MYIEVKDLRDGGEAAKAFFLYLNTYSDVETEFCRKMSGKSDDVKNDFTLLCVEWLKNLAVCDCYDERNEASVIYAREAAGLLEKSGIPARKKLGARGVPTEICFEREDHAGAAEFMEYYLRRGKNNDDFINAALQSHKTLQQAFTRLCCEWFRLLTETDGGKKYVRLAGKVNTLYRGFPFI